MGSELEAFSSQKLRSELFALRQGQAALSLGRSLEASAWLDRACRLAPQNMAIKLLYASSLVGIDDARAMSQLEAVCASHPAAWLALRLLASQAYRLGELERAAKLVSQILRCSAMPADPPFVEFAAKLAKVSELPGWTGLSHEGLLSTSCPSESWLDGVQVRTPATADGHLFRTTLPKIWRYARTLEVMQRGCHLLGSPIDIDSHNRVQGFVELGFKGRAKQDIYVKGWAWMPGCPDVQPIIEVRAQNRRTVIRSSVASDETYKPSDSDGVARPKGFLIDLAGLREERSIHVVDVLGRDLFGSPLNIAVQRTFSRSPARRALQPLEVAALDTSGVGQVGGLQFSAFKFPNEFKRDRARAFATSGNRATSVDIIIPCFQRRGRTCGPV